MRTTGLLLSAFVLILFSTCKEDEGNIPSSYFIKVTMDGTDYEFDNFQVSEYNAITQSVTLSVATAAFVVDIHINDIENFSGINTGNFETGAAVCLSGIEIFTQSTLTGYSSVVDLGSNKFLRVTAVGSIDADNVAITGTIDDLQVLGVGLSGQDTLLLTKISFQAKVTNKHPDTASLDYIKAKVNNVSTTFYTSGISRYDDASYPEDLWLTANVEEQDGIGDKKGFTLVIEDIYSPPVTGTWTDAEYPYMLYSTYDLKNCSQKNYDSRDQNGTLTITITSVTPSGNDYVLQGTFSGKVSRYNVICCETLNITNGEFKIKI